MNLIEALTTLRLQGAESLTEVNALASSTSGFEARVAAFLEQVNARTRLLQETSMQVTGETRTTSTAVQSAGAACAQASADLRERYEALLRTLQSQAGGLAELRGETKAAHGQAVHVMGEVERSVHQCSDDQVTRVGEAMRRVRGVRARLDERLGEASRSLAALMQVTEAALAAEAEDVQMLTDALARGQKQVREVVEGVSAHCDEAARRFTRAVTDDILAPEVVERAARLSASLHGELEARVGEAARELIDKFLERAVRPLADSLAASHEDTLPVRAHLTEQTLALRDGPNLRRHLKVAAEFLNQLQQLDPAGPLAQLLY